MKIAVLSSKFWQQIADSSFLESRNQMVMFIITSKLNSAFGMIGKAKGVKMTAEAVGKNSSSHFKVKNLFAHVVMQWNMSAKFGKFFYF